MEKVQRVVVMLVIAAMVLFAGARMATAQQTPKAAEQSGVAKDTNAPKTQEPQRTEVRPERPRREGEAGQRGQFDPARMMESMLGRYKEALAPTDDEWKVIEPLLKKVLEARMQTRMGGFGRRGGEAPSQANAEADALRTTLDSKTASPDEIKSKLTAFRESQKKKDEALQKAREELRKVLTVKQEASLVLSGVLD